MGTVNELQGTYSNITLTSLGYSSNDKNTFANPESISALHVGMLTMLGFFHYCNRNNHPFKLALDPNRASELLAVGMIEEQIEFIRKTAGWVQASREYLEVFCFQCAY